MIYFNKTDVSKVMVVKQVPQKSVIFVTNNIS